MAKKYIVGLLATLAVVMGLSSIAGLVFVSSAKAAPASPSVVKSPQQMARVNCRIGGSHAWSHLGGDPVWNGGVSSVSQLGVIVKSAAGQRSLICLGLNQVEWKTVKKNIGKATSCVMPYGEKFIAMSYHSDGASVDRPTTFLDPRYKGKSAPAYCLTVVVKEGKTTVTIKLKWPKACANAALKSVSTSAPGSLGKPKGKPTIVVKGNCNVVIVGNNNHVDHVCSYEATIIKVVCSNGVNITKSFTGKGNTKAKAKANAKKAYNKWVQKNGGNCNKTVTPPPPPPVSQSQTLVLCKRSNVDVDAGFPFSWQQVNASNNPTGTRIVTWVKIGQCITESVNPGRYHIWENDSCPSGWQCDTGGVFKDVPAAGSATATLFNKKMSSPPPQKARLTVVKQANAQGCFSFHSSGPEGFNNNFTLCTGQSVSYEGEPGTVTASEDCPSGWQCQGSQSVNIPAGGSATLTFTNSFNQPPPPTYSATCSGELTPDKSNRVIRWTASGTASNGAAATDAAWSFFPDGSSTTGLTVVVTHNFNSTQYFASVIVAFSDGGKATATCSRSTGGSPPPPPYHNTASFSKMA